MRTLAPPPSSSLSQYSLAAQEKRRLDEPGTLARRSFELFKIQSCSAGGAEPPGRLRLPSVKLLIAEIDAREDRFAHHARQPPPPATARSSGNLPPFSPLLAQRTEFPCHTYPFDAQLSRHAPRFGFRSPVDAPRISCSTLPPYFPITPATSPQWQQPPLAESEEEESTMMDWSVALPSLPSFPPSLPSLLLPPTFATCSFISYPNSRRGLLTNHPHSPRRSSFAADSFAFHPPSHPSRVPPSPSLVSSSPPTTSSNSSDSAKSVKPKSNVLADARPLPKNKICSICKAGFARFNDLKRHMRIHTGEAPFQCRRCGIKFRRSDARKRHELKEVC